MGHGKGEMGMFGDMDRMNPNADGGQRMMGHKKGGRGTMTAPKAENTVTK